MIAWLERAMPFAAVPADDPLLRYDIRRVRWGQSARKLTGFSLLAVFVAQLLVILLRAMFVSAAQGQFGSYISFYASGEFIGWLFLVGVFASFVLDIVSMVASVSSIAGDMVAGRWDLLRLSNVRAEQFVAAKCAVAQARAWRVMVVVVAVRVGVLVAILLDSLVVPRPYSRFILFVYQSAYLLVYIVEPLWRMQALTGIGMAIAARVGSATGAILTGFVFVLTLWVIQVLLVVMVGSSAAADPGNNLLLALFLYGPLLAILLGLALHALYRRAQMWSIAYAIRHAFELE